LAHGSFWNPDNASHASYIEEMRVAAAALGVTLIPVPVRVASEFDDALCNDARASRGIRDDGGSSPPASRQEDRGCSCTEPTSRDVPAQRKCGGWRAHVLQRKPPQPVSAAPTGSTATGNTTARARVASNNALTDDEPWARTTSSARPAISAACLRTSVALAVAQRVSMRTLRPMLQPNRASSCRKLPTQA
jgi:hypothetical protein